MYVLDTNAIPPRYVLMKLDNSNRTEYWDSKVPHSNPPITIPGVLTKLLKLLSGLMFEENLFIGDSVTNWEALYALHDSTSTDRIFWMKRDIADTITDAEDPWKEFDDARDNIDVKNRLDKLVAFMTNELGGSNNHVHTTNIDSVLSITNKNNAAFTSYMNEFHVTMRSLLMSEVDRVIQSKQTWFSNAYGSGLTGDLYLDMLHHCSFSRGKVHDFEGR